MKRFLVIAGALGFTVAVFGGAFAIRLYIARATPAIVAVESEETFQSEAVASTSPGSIRIPIFIYHSVRPDYATQTAADKQFTITPELLEAQLAFMQNNGYTVISMDQLALDIKNATTSGVARPVVLTFDDGWENQFTYAFPLLEKYHDTATFFIYTHPIIVGDANYMTWEQIKALDAAGMTIGSHTLTHPYLSKLTPEQLHAEVFNSKQILEQHLGKPVVHFASPFGYTSAELVTLLAEAGYTTGRTTYKGMYHSKADILHLTGYLVHNTLFDFTWALRYSS